MRSTGGYDFRFLISIAGHRYNSDVVSTQPVMVSFQEWCPKTEQSDLTFIRKFLLVQVSHCELQIMYCGLCKRLRPLVAGAAN